MQLAQQSLEDRRRQRSFEYLAFSGDFRITLDMHNLIDEIRMSRQRCVECDKSTRYCRVFTDFNYDKRDDAKDLEDAPWKKITPDSIRQFGRSSQAGPGISG